MVKDTSSKLYVNGKDEGITGPARTTTTIDASAAGDYLFDELMVYDRALEPFEIKQMAGRIFLDLSGNKYHAVPMGGGFDMSDRNPANGNGLGGGYASDLGEGLKLNEVTDSNQSLDLAAHIKGLSALSKGSISFWAKTLDSSATERTILSASNLDNNNSYYRLIIRDNGTLRQEVLNDGSELCKVSTDATVDLSDKNWHHVVVLVDDGGVNFLIDGKSVSSVVPAGASNDRAFFTDIDKISHFAIGYHKTSDEANSTNYFTGELDEFHIYDRVLTNAEIQ